MSLKQTIRRVLREQVNEAYLKPSENMEKLINNWLEKLFSGSKMYYEQSYKTRHDFEWCNNGKEIATVILFFDEDTSVNSDKRPTSERDFKSGSLSIPKSTLNDLLRIVPIKRNYLKYKIEEWFDNNILPTLIDKMGRTDIQIDEINEYPETVQVCVPPVEKPDDVTLEDMIDLVIKNTLFKRNELLRYEEEEPGYIEKIYLGKLRNTESQKLRR